MKTPNGGSGHQSKGIEASDQVSETTKNAARRMAREELHGAILPLQRAIETILNSPQESVGSATELARTFKIEQTLAWRVWRLVQASSGEEAASYVFGSGSLRAFLTAAGKHGVPAPVLDAVRKHYHEYREFIDQFAGDDATLKLMLGPLRDDRDGAALAENQTLFDASRIRIGCQASSQIHCCFMFREPGETHASLDVIDAVTDLWWLRPDGCAVLAAHYLIQTRDHERGTTVPHEVTPMDLEAEQEQRDDGHSVEMPLLHEFCTGDSTLLKQNSIGDTNTLTAHARSIGRSDASTICNGRRLNAVFPPLTVDPHSAIAKSIYVPSELLLIDLYVAADLVDEGYVFRPLVTDPIFWPGPATIWTPRLDLEAMGGTFQTIEPTDLIDNPTKMARYRELVAWSLERIGRPREDFYCFRLRLPMPPIGMTITLETGSPGTEV